MSKFRLAIVQMLVDQSREKNLIKAAKLVREAAQNGSRIVALPEYFTCYVTPETLRQHEETDDGPTSSMLARAAKDNNIFLIGGTYPEAVPGSHRVQNTCKVFNPRGENIATFRKLHMYDVDLLGVKITESEFTKPGPSFVTVDTDVCKMGLGICVDLRFPEVSRIYTRQGCNLLMFIAGFGLKTGPDHWELLIRTRAVDNQVFTVGIGPARNSNAPYVTYGYSCIADPWGGVVCRAGEGESIEYVDIDLAEVDEVRKTMPYDVIRRDDLFDTIHYSDGTPV